MSMGRFLAVLSFLQNGKLSVTNYTINIENIGMLYVHFKKWPSSVALSIQIQINRNGKLKPVAGTNTNYIFSV